MMSWMKRRRTPLFHWLLLLKVLKELWLLMTCILLWMLLLLYVNQSTRKSCFCCGKVSLLLVGKNVLRLRQLLLIQLAQKGFIALNICVIFKDINKSSAACLHFQTSKLHFEPRFEFLDGQKRGIRYSVHPISLKFSIAWSINDALKIRSLNKIWQWAIITWGRKERLLKWLFSKR